MSNVPILGYWDIRGRAQPIRYLLVYSGVEYNDKRYSIGNTWFQEKHTLDLDFPNIPYWIDGDVKLTQSLTILRYLGRKYDLIATDEKELARQELTEQQLGDIRAGLLGLISKSDYLENKSTYVKDKLIPQLEQLVEFLGSNDWLSKQLGYVDFLAYESLDWFRLFTPETIAKFPTLEQYLTRFEDLDQINQYQNSPDYKDWPLFGPMNYWDPKNETTID